MDKITVYIFGDKKEEHSTFIESNGNFMGFYTDGYDGTSVDEIVSLIKFLGIEVFLVANNTHIIPEHIKSKCVDYREFL